MGDDGNAGPSGTGNHWRRSNRHLRCSHLVFGSIGTSTRLIVGKEMMVGHGNGPFPALRFSRKRRAFTMPVTPALGCSIVDRAEVRFKVSLLTGRWLSCEVSATCDAPFPLAYEPPCPGEGTEVVEDGREGKRPRVGAIVRYEATLTLRCYRHPI